MLEGMRLICALLAVMTLAAAAGAQDKSFSLEPTPLPNPPTTTQETKPPVNVVAGLVEYIAPRFCVHTTGI